MLKAPYNVGPADGGEEDVETHYPIYLDDARTQACFEAARHVCSTMPNSVLLLWREQKGLVAHANNNAMPNVHGVQFHPESILSEHGHAMLDRFLARCA